MSVRSAREDELPPLEILRGCAADGRAWVRTLDDDRPVGYLPRPATGCIAGLDRRATRS